MAQTEQQRAALGEVLRVNAYLSQSMRENAPQGEVDIIKQEQLNARAVLAVERGLASLPFRIGPTELEAIQLHFQMRGTK